MAVSNSTLTTSHELPHGTNAFAAHDPVAKTRRLIDEEIQRLEDRIRIIKSRRNCLAPISHLPPELLSKIFSFSASDVAKNSPPLEWIKVSHISRHWRAVALDCPSLWGNLVFTRPKWSEEMLKRSKMAGLVVNADLTFSTPRIFEAVRLALHHGPRIHVLRLCAASTTIERLLSTHPPLQTPMIQSLSLSVPPVNRYGTDQGFTIPENVLNGETPYLKQLDLRRCNISWESRLLQGLTHLTIHDIKLTARPTTQQLVNTLERMPALEVLDFRDALPLSPFEKSGFTANHMIDLAHLTDLTINSTVTECANLVGLIKIPATARVHLSCSAKEANSGDFSGIMRILSNPKGASHSREQDAEIPQERKIIRVLHIRHETPVSLVVHGWTAPLSPEVAHPGFDTPDIQLHLSWHYSSPTNVDDIVVSICEAIHIAHLRSLCLAHVPGITKKMWTSTFGLLTKLHSVHVAGDPVDTFIPTLREIIPSSPSAQMSPLSSAGGTLGVRRPGLRRRRSAVPGMYFPQLKSLTIQDTSFSDQSDTGGLMSLLGCLKERCERKAEIQELRLRECSYINQDSIDLLEDVVPNVDWDRIRVDDNSDEMMTEEEDMDDYLYGVGDYNMDSDDMDSELGIYY